MIMQSNKIFIVTKEKLINVQDIHISVSIVGENSSLW